MNTVKSQTIEPLTVESLNSEIESLRESLWPEIAEPAELSPLLNLELGEVSSDLPLRLASKLKKSPQEVGETLVAKLSNKLQSTSVELFEGFLNFKGSGTKWYLNKDSTQNALTPSKTRYVVAPGESSTLSALRLSSLAVVSAHQSIHLGCSPELLIDQQVVPIGKTTGETLRKCLEALLKRTPVQSNLSIEKDGATNLLFLTQRSVPASVFRDLSHRNRDGENILIHVLTPAWLTPFEEEFSTESILELDNPKLRKLCYLLTGGLRADELELRVASSSEKANLLWFADSLLERVSRLSLDNSKVSKTEDVELLPIEKILAIRLKFIEDFARRAAVFGQTRNFITATEHLTSVFAGYFNSPDLRYRIERNKLSNSEEYLLGSFQRELGALNF